MVTPPAELKFLCIQHEQIFRLFKYYFDFVRAGTNPQLFLFEKYETTRQHHKRPKICYRHWMIQCCQKIRKILPRFTQSIWNIWALKVSLAGRSHSDWVVRPSIWLVLAVIFLHVCLPVQTACMFLDPGILDSYSIRTHLLTTVCNVLFGWLWIKLELWDSAWSNSSVW